MGRSSRGERLTRETARPEGGLNPGLVSPQGRDHHTLTTQRSADKNIADIELTIAAVDMLRDPWIDG